MYLKTIAVENVGPISRLCAELPFRDGLPLPLVLVGPNGSGKSTLLSFIVNALVGFKQQAFEQTEIVQDRVYRVRSTTFLRGGANWYHVKLQFEEGLWLDEWMLDRPKKAFEAEVRPLPVEEGWKQIQEDESDLFQLMPQVQTFPHRTLSRPIQRLFGENVVLFFPSDRFELPDWLNEGSLTPDLRFPEPTRFRGQTPRRIFSRALLKPTLEWFKAVVFDALLPEVPSIQLTTDTGLPAVPSVAPGNRRDDKIIRFVTKVLARILDADSDNVWFQFSNRNVGVMTARFERLGRLELIPNILGLSAGQAALFCIFSNVLRDFDLAGARLNEIADVRGIVLLDEADLHLHVDLQYRILPELMKTFPRVQFILTAHSPLLVMGMEKTFGDEGFRIIDMPSGDFIGTESFSEFGHALSAFTRTRAFDQRVLDQIQRAARPVVMVEGKSDVTHLQMAWAKLHPERPLPWNILSAGGIGTKENRGGADMLRTMLRACCFYVERPVLGLFDHDREGMEQFESLKTDGFQEATETTHWKHSSQPVHSLLLPVPPGREKFVSPKAKSCFLAIEHYYSDTVLNRFGVADDPVVADSAVFGITNDSRKRARFTDALPSLDKSEFKNFELLFNRLTILLEIQGDQAPTSPPPEPVSLPQTFGSGDNVMEMPSGSGFTPTVLSTDDSAPCGPAPEREAVKSEPQTEKQTSHMKTD